MKYKALILIIISGINFLVGNYKKENTSKKPVYGQAQAFTSVDQLRKLTNVKLNIVYKTTGAAAGEWAWDSKDTRTADNTGTVIVTAGGKRLKRKYTGFANIEWFGAKPNDKNFDNAAIIINAITSSKNILFPPGKFYAIKNQIAVEGDNLNLKVTGATILNMNYDAKTFLFFRCNHVTIVGGTFTRPVVPTVQDGKDQHTMQFLGGTDINVSNVHISYSPEVGIGLTNVLGANIINNTIDHTLRDGVYAQYSENIKYIGNKLSFIKDDALSMHDYGIAAQKSELIKAGYQQAGHSVIANNTITNAIEGVASIGCTALVISNNTINRTANAGIAVFDSETLFAGGTARVNNVRIINNRLNNCGDTAFVNGIVIPNGGQLSTGRAAIYLADNGKDNLFTSGKLRLSNIYVSGNVVTNSAVNGILCANIDGLKMIGNSFINCHSNTQNAPKFTGNICELFNCTGINVSANNVLDNRAAPLHDSSFLIDNCSGTFVKGKDKGWRSFEISIGNSPNLKAVK